MTADQFLVSAAVSSAPLTDAGLSVGRRILEAVRATREAVGTNTNLGIVLLSAPLLRAAELPGGDLRANLGAVLDGMTMDDTRAVFDAIVLASPGGLGTADANDVREEPKVHLLEAMREAAGRDRVARQYVTRFEDVFGVGLAALDAARANGKDGMWPAVSIYMAFLAGFEDSHVARKHGNEVASRVRREAIAVRASLDATVDKTSRVDLLMEFDRRLKARDINPGTSADLTVACLLVDSIGRNLA
jgi:triphosphoribosyl-dephospho-CoA synthase